MENGKIICQTAYTLRLDKYWGDRPPDLCIGDILVLPPETVIEETCMKVVHRYGNIGDFFNTGNKFFKP